VNQTFVEEDEINIDEDEQDRTTEVLKKTTPVEVKEDTPTEVKETTATEVKAMREYLCNKCPRDSRLFFVFEK
jgi:hypothetical protein